MNVNKLKLSGAELVTLGRIKNGGGNIASYSDPARTCAEYSRLWDLGLVDDLGTQQVVTARGLKAYRALLPLHIAGAERTEDKDGK